VANPSIQFIEHCFSCAGDGWRDEGFATRPQDLAPVYPYKFVRGFVLQSATILREGGLDPVNLSTADVGSKPATLEARPCKLHPYPKGLLSELEIELCDFNQVEQFLTNTMSCGAAWLSPGTHIYPLQSALCRITPELSRAAKRRRLE
jgi:hypothetical protein